VSLISKAKAIAKLTARIASDTQVLGYEEQGLPSMRKAIAMKQHCNGIVKCSPPPEQTLPGIPNATVLQENYSIATN
jgi:hypothetical protein